jgi:Competence protein CoiA-like family
MINISKVKTDSSTIKIPYALSGGQLIHISNVSSGLAANCVCLVCNSPLIARKGQKMRHHFAHWRPVDCNPETVIHQLGKRLLNDRIQSALTSNQPLNLEWNCTYCGDAHPGNLLKLARAVHVERSFGSCRPDIAICGTNDKPIAFLEIVVTHPPDDAVLNFSKKHGVEIFEFHVQSETDLEQIKSSAPLVATSGTYCPKQKCSNCRARLSENKLHVKIIECYRCKRGMKIAFASRDRIVRGPDQFSNDEIAGAQHHGVVLERRYSKTMDTEYVANICPQCKALFGNHFMYEYMDWKSDAVCWDCPRAQRTILSPVDPRQISLL